MGSLRSAQRAWTEKEGLIASKIRALIAEHSATDIESVTPETHFTDDLGYDQLDIVELIIMIESQFGDLEFAEDMHFVGDLIRQIEASGAVYIPNDVKSSIL